MKTSIIEVGGLLSVLSTRAVEKRLARLPGVVRAEVNWVAGSTTVKYDEAVTSPTGLGMAMLYPNLSAAVADIAHPSWRASAIGIYRFWRDLGYGIGALCLGAAAALGGRVESAFWFVAIAMGLSGLVLHHWGEETHPRLNPAR